MDLQVLIEKKKNYATKQVGEDLILVPLKNNVADMNTLFNLNETARFIWEQLKDGANTESIRQAIESEFDVDAATAKVDLDAFLEAINAYLGE